MAILCLAVACLVAVVSGMKVFLKFSQTGGEYGIFWFPVIVSHQPKASYTDL